MDADDRLAANCMALVAALAMALACSIAVPTPARAELRAWTIVSRAPGGALSNGQNAHPSLSPDGRVVAFSSAATNLVADDTRAHGVYAFNRVSGSLRRVGRGPEGAPASQLSEMTTSIDASGQRIVHDSFLAIDAQDTNGTEDVFRVDVGQEPVRISRRPDGSNDGTRSGTPTISANGQVVAFQTAGGSLAPPDRSDITDLYVADEATGAVELISVNAAGTGGGNSHSVSAMLSRSGNVVVFSSHASNLAASDTDRQVDVYLYKRGRREMLHVSRAASGAADGASGGAAVTQDGELVAFETLATNLAPEDTNGVADIVITAPGSGAFELVSVATDGTQADGPSGGASLSGDARYVVFWSDATNLVAGDDNDRRDIFVRDRVTRTTTRVTEPDGADADGSSTSPTISSDGYTIAFLSNATNLAPGADGTTEVLVGRNPVAPNRPPVVSDIARTTAEDTPFELTLPAADPDGDAVTVVITSKPVLGRLSGTLPIQTYTPEADVHGEDSFGYRACDSFGLCRRATVHITITPVDDPPAVPAGGNLTVRTVEEIPVSAALAATDADGELLTYTASAPSVTFDAATLTYQPAPEHHGTEIIDVTVTDGKLISRFTVTAITEAIPDIETEVEAKPAVAQVRGGARLYLLDLTAFLTRADTGEPLVGHVVRMTQGGQPICQATTDADGRAVCSGTIQGDVAVLRASGYDATFDRVDRPGADLASSTDRGGLLQI